MSWLPFVGCVESLESAIPRVSHPHLQETPLANIVRTVHLGRLWEEVGSRRGSGEAGSLAVVSPKEWVLQNELRISTTRTAPKQNMLQPLVCAMGDFISVLVVGSQIG